MEDKQLKKFGLDLWHDYNQTEIALSKLKKRIQNFNAEIEGI